MDIRTAPIKAKIANAEQMKVHHMFVIGPRDLESNAGSELTGSERGTGKTR